MYKKAALVLIPLATAAGPMAFYSAPEWWSKIAPLSSTGTTASAVGVPGMPAPPANGSKGGQTDGIAPGGELPNRQPPVSDLSEVLRFDVTPAWVVTRWTRVSTGLAQLQLQGYRVPLVTGTRQDDLAGALTYYFNTQQKVEQLTFQGTTGDVRRLVHFLAARFGFRRRAANDPGLLVYEPPDRTAGPRGSLRVETSGVVKSAEPFARFRVTLRLERPTRR